MITSKKKIVVVGGGTGTHTVLRGLKKFHDQLDITAIVSMADSGGSTGRLRDEFGYLPVGDVRMALAALAKEDDEQEYLLRQLFMYRFEQGSGLSGHNAGNLLLIALTNILGSEAKAIEAASKILQICGTVLPVSTDNMQLVADYSNGKTIVGEHEIDDPKQSFHDARIVKLYTEPKANLYAAAKEALEAADMIVMGPGDLYSSLLANCVVDGFVDALQKSSGVFVYITSLMERPGQTCGLKLSDTVSELCTYAGRCPDVVAVNDARLPEEGVRRYQEFGSQPIYDDSDTLESRLWHGDLLANELIDQGKSDLVKRSLIRHDSEKIATMLLSLLE